MEQQIYKYSNPNVVKAKGKKHGLIVNISSRKDKKYMVKTPEGKTIHFGGLYEDYTKHNDETRRRNFLSRNARWKNQDKYTAGWLSYHLLW